MAEDAFYTAMPNIKGSEMVNPVICVSSGYKTWGKWMFSAEADPKAVAAWLDTVCTQDYAKLVTFGIEGVTYEVDADSGLYTGTYSRDYSVIKDTKSARGYDLWIDSIMPDASMAAWYNQYYGDLVWATYDDFLASAYYNDVIKTTYTENQCRNLELLCGYSKEVELVYNFNDDTGMIAPMNTLDEAEVLDLYSADLNTMLGELNVGFLTGLYDINDLDSVIEKLNILGLQEVLAVRQAQYDRYYGKVE